MERTGCRSLDCSGPRRFGIYFFLQLSIILLFFLVSFGFAIDFEVPEADKAIEDISYVLTTFFPPSKGSVTYRNGEKLRLDLEGQLVPVTGILLSVVQAGAPFYHPLSKALMGYSEREIGTIQLLESEGGPLEARVVQETNPIKVGHEIRLKGVRIPVAIVSPSSWDRGFLKKKLAASLEETGRFSVVNTVPTFPVGGGEGEEIVDFKGSDSGMLEKIGKEMGVHYVVAVMSEFVNTHVDLDVILYVVPWEHQIARMKVPMKLSEEDLFLLEDTTMEESLQKG